MVILYLFDIRALNVSNEEIKKKLDGMRRKPIKLIKMEWSL